MPRRAATVLPPGRRLDREKPPTRTALSSPYYHHDRHHLEPRPMACQRGNNLTEAEILTVAAAPATISTSCPKLRLDNQSGCRGLFLTHYLPTIGRGRLSTLPEQGARTGSVTASFVGLPSARTIPRSHNFNNTAVSRYALSSPKETITPYYPYALMTVLPINTPKAQGRRRLRASPPAPDVISASTAVKLMQVPSALGGGASLTSHRS